SLPVATSHTRAVLSWDAVTIRAPSGLHAALESILFSLANSVPVATSHTRAVLSLDAVIIRAPCRLHAALPTPSPWPSTLACPVPPRRLRRPPGLVGHGDDRRPARPPSRAPGAAPDPGEFLPGPRLPHPRSFVGHGEDPRPVRAPCRAGDRAAVTCEPGQL